MSSPPEPNPYAPTALPGSRPPVQQAVDTKRASTWGIMVVTWGGIIVSGAIFGTLLGFLPIVFAAEELPEIMFLVPAGMIVGGVLAAISGIPAVIVVTCLSAPLVSLSKGWTRAQARRFAAVCGFLGGSLPLLLTDVTDPYTALLACLPGLFGAVGTVLFMRWIYGPARHNDVTV